MSTLKITIETVNETDFDNNPITFKSTRSVIDDIPTNVYCNCPANYSDADIRVGHKGKLTEAGFVWDTEE